MTKIDTIQEVRKFNENHDASGRFASAGGGGASAIMDKIRNNVQGQSDDMLLSAWKMNKDNTDTASIAVNVALETELENRGLIKLNDDTFEYEVVSKPTKATQAKKPAAPTNSDNEGNQLSKEQLEYFKDSKARDENGNLLTLYHNTDAAGIETFRTQTEHGYGGLYMTDTQSVAQGFKGGTTYKLYADLKNPLVVDAGGKAYDSIEPPEGMGRKYSFGSKTVDTQAIAAYARDSGYDGVIVNNVKEPTGHGTDVIAFHPEQVKAVQNTAPTRDTSINKRDIDHIEETE